ncbi:SCO2524 family protein [Streptomyces luteogriseus]|uniref:SCO2524 family protein n=1 Tax=Streptomyces luteogriseus TaxID=68233 RepID=UPI003796497B
MQIKPRQHLLEIWQATARHSFDGGAWDWGDLGGLSSVADAERLLCLLYPATEIPAFRMDSPDTTDRNLLRAMSAAGGRLDLPAGLVAAVADFMRRHTGPHNSPTFAGGHYFAPKGKAKQLTDEQRALGVVDSYSLSITLCLATLGFLDAYETHTRRSEIRQAIAELRDSTSNRLTAAMVSLLRSFTVSVYDADSPQGRTLTGLLGQSRTAERHVLHRFRQRFRALRSVIAERLVLGVDIQEGLKEESQYFECGWAWGIVKDAPEVETCAAINPQPDGVAAPVPSLHFTVVALDGIENLFSDRTLTLGLLDAEQQQLAEALRLRWEITRQYWSGVARFDARRWPLEDIPWPTTQQDPDSGYSSLSVISLLVHDLVRRRDTDDDLTRVTGVLERLADRARITSRMTRDDPTARLHAPGVTHPLPGGEHLGPPMQWMMTDFSAQLLKRTVQLCALSRDLTTRDRLARLAEDIFEHVWQRRIRGGEVTGLWDDLRGVYPGASAPEGRVSWSFTERVVEVMVQAHHMYRQPPPRSRELADLAAALIGEAVHLFGTEQLESAPVDQDARGRVLRSVEVTLHRARGLLDEQPGTAYVLATEALGALDTLARARASSREG